jgi:Uma2 family endonuclease
MIVCGPQPERHLEKPPELIVEVLSPATQKQDQVTKRQLYYENRVPFYLIVDPATNSINLLQAGDADYGPIHALDQLDITLPSGCRIAISRERVLR